MHFLKKDFDPFLQKDFREIFVYNKKDAILGY